MVLYKRRLKVTKKQADKVKNATHPDDNFIEKWHLLPAHKVFIEHFLTNGYDKVSAFAAAYPNASKERCRKNAGALYNLPAIQRALQSSVAASGITPDRIREYAMDYTTKGLENPSWAGAGASTLSVLAKASGMLDSVRTSVFTAQNPAVFLTYYSPDEIREFTEKGRIVE